MSERGGGFIWAVDVGVGNIILHGRLISFGVVHERVIHTYTYRIAFGAALGTARIAIGVAAIQRCINKEVVCLPGWFDEAWGE